MISPDQGRGNDFAPTSFLSIFFRTAKAILFSPKLFYERMETEGGLRNPTIFLACCVLIHSLIIGLVCQKQILIILNIVGGVGMPFVTAGILFLIITRLFKASGTYEATFRVNAYAAATALFSWIPLVGFFLECYRLYLIVIGLSRVFSIRTSRAVLAMVITIIIYIAVLGPIIAHIVGSPVPGAAP